MSRSDQETGPPQRIPRRDLLVGAGVTLVAATMAVIALIAAAGPHDIAFFTREPATAVEGAKGCEGLECAYAGAQANLAVLIWWGAAVTTLWCAAWARRIGSEWASFLLAGGLLTALLALDDAFQVHEIVAPTLLPGSEREMYLGYGLAGLAFLWAFRRRLLRTDVAVLLAAGALLVVSAGFDQLVDRAHLYEDGAKLVGIVLWSIYFVGTSVAIVTGSGKRSAGPR